jgi:hypothetical protein
MEHWLNDTDRGKGCYGRKRRPSLTRSSTNPTRTVLRFISCLRSERTATNRHSHGTAVSKRLRLGITTRRQTKIKFISSARKSVKIGYSATVTFVWSAKRKSYHLPDCLRHLALNVSPAFSHIHLLSSLRNEPQFAKCPEHTRDRLPT